MYVLNKKVTKNKKKIEIYNIINHLELEMYNIPIVSNHQSINQVFTLFFVCE